jgi:hypothetical protein
MPETSSPPEAHEAVDKFVNLASSLGRRLAEYGDWRDRLVEDIQSYLSWLEREEMGAGEDELRIYELIESLLADRLSVALVAEFSRGKSELINAIFFADHKRRLLPSSAGRTTMCPTEIKYDANEPPSISLLPVETRKTSLTIADYKRDPVNWTVLPLNVDSASEMADALREIVATKTVDLAQAKALGLYNPDFPEHRLHDTSTDAIEVPVWRHAIVNYPHPLLEQGLVILDTPGLNALGTEPELTVSMLPNAHAVLFVLAADTGVTRSDLDIWKDHVCFATRTRTESRLVVLNKIDSLWDELQDDSTVEASIARQVKETARILAIQEKNIFPVSAQKGLLAKVRGNDLLLRRSGLTRLENALSTDIIAAKQELVRNKVADEIGGMVEATAATVRSRLDAVMKEYNELQAMRGKSQTVVNELVNRLRDQRALYEKEVESFEITRRMLSAQTKALLNHMSMNSFDRLMHESRQDMKESWTTQGLRRGMATFFAGAAKRADSVATETADIKSLVESIYAKFHKEHGLPRIKPASFSVLPFRSEFKRLESEAEAFRNSSQMLMSEQHFVIKKFFITLASRARELFHECNRSTKAWVKAVLTPIYTQIQEHKIMIDRRIENLEKIQSSQAALGQRITELEAQIETLESQHKTIRGMLGRIRDPRDESPGAAA